MKKIFNLTKTHIYVFGVLSNIVPIIGLFILEGVNFEGLHQYQFWAWISGAIYYIFVWVVAFVAFKKIDNKTKTLEKQVEDLQVRIEALEKQGGKK